MRTRLRRHCENAVLLVPVFALVCANTFASSPVNIDSTWLPISQAELDMKAPVVDPKAGVEILFWRVHVLDEVAGDRRSIQRTLFHYVRMKVFSDSGRSHASTIELPYGEGSGILFVTGRTIRPDGTVVELSKDAVHDQVKVQVGGRRLREKSFSMPAVEVGSIVEYRYRENRDETPRYLRVQFQKDIPIQHVTWFFRPFLEWSTSEQMSLHAFNCQPGQPKAAPDGFISVTLDGVPAFREEPMMPGEADVRPWALAYYHRDKDQREPNQYWATVGKSEFSDLKMALKTGGDLNQAVPAAVAGAASDEDKAVHLIRYIRAHVRDVGDRLVSDSDRAEFYRKLPRDRFRTPDEVLKSGLATTNEMNTLFAAMAAEAGLEVRPVLAGDISDIEFDPKLVDRYFLPKLELGIHTAGGWKVYDVSARLLSPRMVRWQQEGMQALLADAKQPQLLSIPHSSPDESTTRRRAKLQLSEDGTLEGDADVTWTGHAAMENRRELDGESEARQQELMKERLLKRYSEAEVSDLRIENAEDTEQPLVLHYHIRVPGYAARTGKRLLFSPEFFQRGVAGQFTASDRHSDVHFPFAWHEVDELAIDYPDGFELEPPSPVTPFTFAPLGSYVYTVSAPKPRQLICRRELVFGAGGALSFQQAVYPKLKALFDRIHGRDGQMFSLRREEQQ